MKKKMEAVYLAQQKVVLLRGIYDFRWSFKSLSCLGITINECKSDILQLDHDKVVQEIRHHLKEWDSKNLSWNCR